MRTTVFRKHEEATDQPSLHIYRKTVGTQKVLANYSVLHTIPEVVSELFLPEPLPNALDTTMKERGHNVDGVDRV